MKDWVDKARRPEMIGGIGGFAGLFDASALTSYKRPLLATSTDGVGTKVAIAQAMDVHDTIGFDLVGMVVDDLVVCGAEPLFMTDYIACGRVVPERIAAIVKGIAEACVEAGCALVGGETAEHPGLLGPDEYDVAGAATGVVEADDLLGPERVRPGDVVLAMASSGLHSNGYSLVRHVVAQAGWACDRDVPELGRTLGEELLEPTRIYAKACLDAGQARPGPTRWRTSPAAGWPPTSPGCCRRSCTPRSSAAPGRRRRSSTWSAGSATYPSPTSRPPSTAASAWSPCSIPRAIDAAIALLDGFGIHAWVAGEVAAASGPGGTVELVGQHPGW